MAKDKRTKITLDPRRFLTGSGPGQSRLRTAAHAVVCQQGAPDDTLFYIEQGWVKITAVSPAGKEAVLAIRGSGTFVGTRSLIERHRRRATVTALSDCSLVRIARAAAIQLVRTEPDFAEMLAIYLARQGQRDQESLTDQLTYPSERRLARLLLRIAGDRIEHTPAEIPMHLSQVDLASMIGTTRPRVSHFMNKFKRSGFIGYGRQGFVTVHKSLRSIDRDRRS